VSWRSEGAQVVQALSGGGEAAVRVGGEMRGKETLLVNAAIATEGEPDKEPWIVDLDL